MICRSLSHLLYVDVLANWSLLCGALWMRVIPLALREVDVQKDHTLCGSFVHGVEFCFFCK